MKPLKKMISINKLLNKVQAASLFKTLVACMFSTVFAIPTVAHAQASACVAGETLQTFTMPAGWAGGATGGVVVPYVNTVGAGANAVTLTFSISNAGGWPYTGGSPTQATLGNIADTVRTQHLTSGAGTQSVLLSTQNLGFNRPVNKLRFISADIDSNVFQDTIRTRVNGSILPTSLVPVTPANITINAGAGTATANYNGSQCANTSAACNVTSNFNVSGITTASQAFETGPLHQNSTQYVGWNSFSWCLPALANITLRKTWVNATVNDAVTVAAAGGTPALISLASVANTAGETDTGAVQLVPVNSVLTLSETFTTGSAANYNTAVACTGTTGLVGSTLTVGATNTNIVCTYTNTRRIANLAITKTDAKTTTVSGDTNTYSIVVTNNGPLAANNAVVTDPGGVTGLTCSSVSCAAAGGAVCPASPTVAALQGAGLTIPTLPNAGNVTLTLTCSVSATGV